MGLPCCVDYRRAVHRPDPHASPSGAHRAGTAAAGCPLRGQQHLGLSSARAHLIYTPCRWCCCGGAETSNQQGNNEEGEGRCTYRRSTREFFCVDKCKLSVKCFLIKVEKYWVSLLHTHTPGSGWVEESVHRMSRDSTGRFTISDFFLITTPTQGWNNVGSVVGVSQRVCLQRFFRAKAGFVFSTFCKLATSPKRGFVRLTQRRLWQIGLECGAVIWRTFISHTLCSCVALCESGKWQQASVLMAAGEGNLCCLLAPSAGKMRQWN